MMAPAGKEKFIGDVTDPVLVSRGLRKAFGGVLAVEDATFAVPRSQITALIGPNGAGKSTEVSMLSGALRPDGGEVVLEGTDVTGWPANRIAHAGLIRTFQLSRELGRLTVLENLMVTPRNQLGESLGNIFFRPGAVMRQEREYVSRALEILNTYGLYELRDNYAHDLSGGQKRLLELSRAVMAEPNVLLLDEPMAGINPALIDRISEHIVGLRDRGVTILMVEHNLQVVERISQHVIVMAVGRTLATGKLVDLREMPEVVQAYLGGELIESAER